MQESSKVIPLYPDPKDRNSLFTRLVRPHLQAMYRMAYRWTRNREDAEDLVQETLARLVERTDDLLELEKPGPWLIKVLYRNFVDFYRQRQRSPVQRGDSDLSGELQSREKKEDARLLGLQRDLSKALETLQEDLRDVVLLHDTEGYSDAETAAILGIRVGTVKSRLHRARGRLKKFLTAGTI